MVTTVKEVKLCLLGVSFYIGVVTWHTCRALVEKFTTQLFYAQSNPIPNPYPIPNPNHISNPIPNPALLELPEG